MGLFIFVIYLDFLENSETAKHNKTVRKKKKWDRDIVMSHRAQGAHHVGTGDPDVMSVSHKEPDSLAKNPSKTCKSSHLFSSFMNACVRSSVMWSADGQACEKRHTMTKTWQELSRLGFIVQGQPGPPVQFHFQMQNNVYFPIIRYLLGRSEKCMGLWIYFRGCSGALRTAAGN